MRERARMTLAGAWTSGANFIRVLHILPAQPLLDHTLASRFCFSVGHSWAQMYCRRCSSSLIKMCKNPQHKHVPRYFLCRPPSATPVADPFRLMLCSSTRLFSVLMQCSGLGRALHEVIVFICSVHLLGQDVEIGHVNVKQISKARTLHLHHNSFSSMQNCPVHLCQTAPQHCCHASHFCTESMPAHNTNLHREPIFAHRHVFPQRLMQRMRPFCCSAVKLLVHTVQILKSCTTALCCTVARGENGRCYVSYASFSYISSNSHPSSY